jgi:K+-sensing histidine kinase KdpD
MIVVVTYAVHDLAQEQIHLVARPPEFFFLNIVERIEMIIDMFEASVVHSANAKHYLTGEVVTLIIVKTFVYGYAFFEPRHSYRTHSSHLLDVTFLLHNVH